MTTDSMDMLLPQAVAHHAAQRPNDPFVQEVDGAELSWGEALDTSLRWADALDRAGVEIIDGFEVVVDVEHPVRHETSIQGAGMHLQAYIHGDIVAGLNIDVRTKVSHYHVKFISVPKLRPHALRHLVVE